MDQYQIRGWYSINRGPFNEILSIRTYDALDLKRAISMAKEEGLVKITMVGGIQKEDIMKGKVIMSGGKVSRPERLADLKIIKTIESTNVAF